MESIGEDEEGVPPLIGVAVVAGCVTLLALMVLLIPSLREAASSAISGDTDALRAELDSAAGVFTLLVLALMHSVVFYPAEILDAAAGFVWGFWGGLALVMVGWLINAWAAWEIGRHAARPLLYRLIGHDRFIRYQGMVERGGIPFLLGIRVIPIIPFSLFTMVVGAAGVPFKRMMWTTAIGYLPITVLFVYLGTQLEELSPTDPILIVGGAVLITAIIVGHRLRGRLEAAPEPGPEPGPEPAPPAPIGVAVGAEPAERDPDRDDVLGV